MIDNLFEIERELTQPIYTFLSKWAVMKHFVDNLKITG